MDTREEFEQSIEAIGLKSAWVDPAKLSVEHGEPETRPMLEVIDSTEVDTTADPDGSHDFASSVRDSELDPLPVIDEIGYKDDKLQRIPEWERPRERMRELGPSGITTTELLAIVLGSGIRGRNVKNVADDLLTEFDGLRGLSRISSFNLQKVGGIGAIKADVLTAAFELGRRATEEEIERGDGSYGVHLPNGDAIARSVAKQFTARLRDSSQEEMWVVLLDVRNQYRGKTRVYVGCCDQLSAKTGEILNRVVERNLPRYALVHNHPSGKGQPSGADISFTERLVRAGEYLDIELVDHVVLGEDLRSYVSMRQSGLVNFPAHPRANRKIMEDRS